MAICTLNRNLLRSQNCGYQLSEIVNIYLINYGDITGIDVHEGTDTTLGCDEISAITLNTGAKVYKVEPTKNSASFEDTLVVEDNGAKYRNASITFSVAGAFNACQHGNLDALSLGRYFVVVKTSDGSYVAFGRLSPLEAETATYAGGADANGLNIVLSGNVAESPLPLSTDAAERLEGAVAE